MVFIHYIRGLFLSILLVSMSSYGMYSDGPKKKEIPLGRINIDGQKYEYYLLINRKEKGSINIINRTNHPLVLTSGSEKTRIEPNLIGSASLGHDLRTIKPGGKTNFFIYVANTNKEKELGAVESDFLLTGGNFTLMRRLFHKDEL